jgi:hypothetical protein
MIVPVPSDLRASGLELDVLARKRDNRTRRGLIGSKFWKGLYESGHVRFLWLLHKPVIDRFALRLQAALPGRAGTLKFSVRHNFSRMGGTGFEPVTPSVSSTLETGLRMSLKA